MAVRPIREDIEEEEIFLDLDSLIKLESDDISAGFIAAVFAALNGADKQKLLLALRIGDSDLAVDSIRFDLFEDKLEQLFSSDTVSSVAKRAIIAGFLLMRVDAPSSDVLNSISGPFIRKMAQDSARQISDETKLGLRALVGGVHARGVSRADAFSYLYSSIFEHSGFGLNEQQSAAIGKRISALILSGELDPGEIDRYISRIQKDSLVNRARRISITELGEMVNEGFLESWAFAEYGGMKEWVARMDSHTCKRCAAFDGKRAKIQEPFLSDLGEMAMRPEIHPEGFCRMRIVL